MASRVGNGEEVKVKEEENSVVIRYKIPILNGIRYILIPLAKANRDEIERQVVEWMIEAEVYSREVFDRIMEYIRPFFDGPQ